MYKAFFPQTLSPDWVIADDDPDHKYIELLGYGGEFLISISCDPYENKTSPYFLNFQQMKGAFQRFDYSQFDMDCWYASPKTAVHAAIKLMALVRQNYARFLPITNTVFVSLGPVSQYEQIKRSLGGELRKSSGPDHELVYKRVLFLPGNDDYEIAAGNIIRNYVSGFHIEKADFVGGRLCNEDLRFLGKLDHEGKLTAEVDNPIYYKAEEASKSTLLLIVNHTSGGNA
jgi:hypothetical protein